MVGESLIVPRDVEHKPVAEGEAHVLLFEPGSTLNTWNVRDDRSIDVPERLQVDAGWSRPLCRAAPRRAAQRCYDLASSRARQYLDAEIEHVVRRLQPDSRVLELGCGYGRVTRRLAAAARCVIGIDTAAESLALASDVRDSGERCAQGRMDAIQLGFRDSSFDAVVCVQNGVFAFGVDPARLLGEALGVTRLGGLTILTSYAGQFWPGRLAWFEAQARDGLLGAVDYGASGDGFIVCADGFRAGRMTRGDFTSLCDRLGVTATIEEVDQSSLFCEIIKDPGG